MNMRESEAMRATSLAPALPEAVPFTTHSSYICYVMIKAQCAVETFRVRFAPADSPCCI